MTRKKIDEHEAAATAAAVDQIRSELEDIELNEDSAGNVWITKDCAGKIERATSIAHGILDNVFEAV